MKKKIFVLGKDERQKHLAGILREVGQDVVYAVDIGKDQAEMLRACDLILLPIAAKEDVLHPVGQYVRKGQKIYGSVFPEKFRGRCEEKEAVLMDYMKDDGVAIQNAVATAEGIIAEAISCSTINLQGSHCLVVGFGRCGEILADKLKGLKCDVTVINRGERGLARAGAYGYHVRSLEQRDEENYDFIFNTVPAQVIDRKLLERQSKDVVIIDIASAPGGVDLAVCEALGMHAKSCQGLPAKYAPKTSAQILAKVIWKWEFSEKGSLDV